MTASLELDRTDWKILRELQQDGRMTNVELARRVGLSPAPCLRRVRVLENDGYILGYRALLESSRLGYGIMMFALVSLQTPGEADLLSFEARAKRWPLVRECYALSGEADFMLTCVAPDLHTAQQFVIEELTPANNVRQVRTMLTLKTSKYEPRVPIESQS
ncbi:MAG: Lrp/AsnC family transcriptional regulator [Hyphomicrobiales bacterium]